MFTKARYEGYGSQRVANYLTKNGIKNREGKNWHPSTIKAILRNPLYIGIMRSGATRSPVQEHLRIIDDETFYVVQANLDARANMYANKPHTPVATCSNALLSGFIFCGHCGARLCVTTSGKGRPRKTAPTQQERGTPAKQKAARMATVTVRPAIQSENWTP